MDMENKGLVYIKNNIGKILLNLLLVWIIISFIIYPNLNIIKNTFVINGNISFKAFGKLYLLKELWKVW